MRQKVWSGLILALFITHNIYGTGATDWAGALTSAAGALQGVQQAQQDKKKSDEKQQQLDQQLGKVTGQENFATAQGQTKGLYTNPVQNLGTPNQGYPIVDPYKNPGYWQQRGQQFQFNMTMAARRAGLTNEKAAEALAAERQMTNKMLGAVGGLLQTAGGQMSKIGAERAKAASGEGKKQAELLKQQCISSTDCTKATTTIDGNTVSGWNVPGRGFVPDSEMGDTEAILQGQSEFAKKERLKNDVQNTPGVSFDESTGIYEYTDDKGEMHRSTNPNTIAQAIDAAKKRQDAQNEKQNKEQQARQDAERQDAATRLQEDKDYAKSKIDLQGHLNDEQKLDFKRRVNRAETVEALKAIIGEAQKRDGDALAGS